MELHLMITHKHTHYIYMYVCVVTEFDNKTKYIQIFHMSWRFTRKQACQRIFFRRIPPPLFFHDPVGCYFVIHVVYHMLCFVSYIILNLRCLFHIMPKYAHI